jgi:hypothetical protein
MAVTVLVSYRRDGTGGCDVLFKDVDVVSCGDEQPVLTRPLGMATVEDYSTSSTFSEV